MFMSPSTRTGWFWVSAAVFTALALVIALGCISRAHDTEFVLALFGLASAVALVSAEVALTKSHIDEAQNHIESGIGQSAQDVSEGSRDAHEKLSRMVLGVSTEMGALGREFRDWIGGSRADASEAPGTATGEFPEHLARRPDPPPSGQQVEEGSNPP